MDLQALTPEQLRARRTIKWNLYPPDVLALWVAEMDYPTAPPIVEALQRAVANETFGYPLDARTSGLGRATADYLGREFGWPVDPEAVFAVPDVLRGIRIAIETFTGSDDPVIVTTPVYMPFFDAVALTGRPQVHVPMSRAEGRHDGRWTLDLDGIERALETGARTLLLCSPYNPLGLVFTDAELLRLADRVEHHRARVISDEIHAPLVFDGHHTPYAALSPVTARHTVTVTAASKAWNLPGLKCAQVVLTNEADVDRWRRLPFLTTIGASSLGIEASIAAYDDGGPWLAEVLPLLEHHANLVVDAVAEMPGVQTVRNEGTYLAWLDCTELSQRLGLTTEPSDWLLEHAKVALNPGLPFHAPPRRFARLNFATTTPILQDALGRMQDALEVSLRRTPA